MDFVFMSLLGFAFMSLVLMLISLLLALLNLLIQVSNFKTEIFKKEISKKEIFIYQPTCLNRLTTTNPGLNTFQRNIDPRKKFHLTNFSKRLIV